MHLCGTVVTVLVRQKEFLRLRNMLVGVRDQICCLRPLEYPFECFIVRILDSIKPIGQAADIKASEKAVANNGIKGFFWYTQELFELLLDFRGYGGYVDSLVNLVDLGMEFGDLAAVSSGIYDQSV